MSSLTKKNSDTSLKFVYSDNNSLSVIFHDNELLIGVVGEFNKNLKELEKKIERIILSRPAVEAGERLGFLPGDMKEKVDPYLRPLYDSLYDLFDFEKIQRMIEIGDIEIAPLAFMRGRTLKNSFAILDESQNATDTQIKMFLTRIGENSKIVVNGDPTQIDLPNKNMSGLVRSKELLGHLNEISVVDFDHSDVVRHPLVSKIVKAYSKND